MSKNVSITLFFSARTVPVVFSVPAAVQESSADAGNAAGVEHAANEENVADAGTVVGTESTTGTVRAEKKSVIDTFFDINYPDERIEKVWPNMKVEVQ